MSQPLRVSEVFVSVQGEGVSVGTPSVFVRLQGCSVGCVWCDTKYSWAASGGHETTLDALLAQIAPLHVDNVVITGGESLEHPAFESLVNALKTAEHRIEVETENVNALGLYTSCGFSEIAAYGYYEVGV